MVSILYTTWHGDKGGTHSGDGGGGSSGRSGNDKKIVLTTKDTWFLYKHLWENFLLGKVPQWNLCETPSESAFVFVKKPKLIARTL